MNKSNFNIFYFLLIFFVLYYGFYIYVGITTPDGQLYSNFLHTYLNIPYWLSIIAAKGSAILLKISGYAVYQKNPVNVTIRGTHGATIAWGCIGVGVIAVWVAFIAAHKAALAYKLRWSGLGILLIFVFNITRISLIVLSYYYHWTYFLSFNAHSTYNFITYVIILILMLVFVFNYNRMEKKQDRIVKPGVGLR